VKPIKRCSDELIQSIKQEMKVMKKEIKNEIQGQMKEIIAIIEKMEERIIKLEIALHIGSSS
jgi:hypothetical protein